MTADDHVPSRLTSTAPVSRSALEAHRELSGRPLNFTPIGFGTARSEPDWNADLNERVIGREPPGPPSEGGVFRRAQTAMIRYEFADPRRIRAVYDPSSPFCGRNMLLVGRLLFLRLHMGVRVGGVFEDEITHDGRPTHAFGWYYRTLAGHLEQGQMDYTLRKDLETGAVAASIRAYSRRSPEANPVLRLGFNLIGRPLQLQFYDDSLSRLERIARAEGRSVG